MKKRLREIQPPNGRSTITVAQAARAFRQARGDTPKVEAFTPEELQEVFGPVASARRAAKHRRADSIAADTGAKKATTKRK